MKLKTPKPINNGLLDQRGKLIVPRTSRELTKTLDYLYSQTKVLMNDNSLTFKEKGFTGLMEIASSDVVITRAVEKLKSNKGSLTPGVDSRTIRDFLRMNWKQLKDFVIRNLKKYNPGPVRRKWIDKPGKKDKRPLGIPDIGDRIIQECIKIVIEPILEAQFFKHSYGFRPYRNAHQAYARISETIHQQGSFWVVEGDIKGFFDNVNHNVLLKQLNALGIKDKRVLMVIKAMLQAGVMDEITESELGTPQGGIISPLLANAYLHKFDNFITREWEEKKLQNPYKIHTNGRSRHITQMKGVKTAKKGRVGGKTRFKPAFFVRYADDWVIITDTKEHAEKLKYRAEMFLRDKLKVELSQDKTLITDVRKRAIRFLGFEIKFRYKGEKFEKIKHGYVTQSKPDRQRLKSKMEELRKNIRDLKRCGSAKEAVHQINIINSVINGLHNYYNITTLVNPEMAKYAWDISHLSYKILKKKFNGFLIKANQTDNQIAKHRKEDEKEKAEKDGKTVREYTTKVPAIEFEGMTIGISNLAFVKCKIDSRSTLVSEFKKQLETKYSEKGRRMYQARLGRKLKAEREDEALSLDTSYQIAIEQPKNKRYNVEYVINRARAFNLSKGLCKCCGTVVGLDGTPYHVHHTKPWLPLKEVNKTRMLAILCIKCHRAVHNKKPFEDKQIFGHINESGYKKIVKLRKELIPA